MSAVYAEKPIDRLTKKAAQLSALLDTVHGAGFESFNSYNDTIKENYLWACADLAQEVSALADQLAGSTPPGLVVTTGSAA